MTRAGATGERLMEAGRPWLRRAPRVEARLHRRPWPWAEANAAAIGAHWDARTRARPRLFNGRVLVVDALEPAPDGAVEAGFLEVDYAALLAWLDGGAPEAGVLNGFAMGALQAADGAYLLGVMGAHTANAGRVYFPCGTPDLSDARPDGTVDLAASVVRELEEETGLEAGQYRVGEGWTLAQAGGRLAFLKPVRLAEPAESARARILANLAAQAEPELADIVIARGPESLENAAVPDFLHLFLRDAFAQDGGTGA